MNEIVWSDGTLFKLTGTVSHHNCVGWSTESPHIHEHKAVTLLGLTVQCGMSSGCSKGLSFFEGTVTGPVYPNMFQTSSVPAICQLYGNEEFYDQQAWAPWHYHQEVRSYVNTTFPDCWMGQKGSTEYSSHSQDENQIDFHWWGYMKDAVYCTQPSTLEELQEETEGLCAAIPVQLHWRLLLTWLLNSWMLIG